MNENDLMEAFEKALIAFDKVNNLEIDLNTKISAVDNVLNSHDHRLSELIKNLRDQDETIQRLSESIFILANESENFELDSINAVELFCEKFKIKDKRHLYKYFFEANKDKYYFFETINPYNRERHFVILQPKTSFCIEEEFEGGNIRMLYDPYKMTKMEGVNLEDWFTVFLNSLENRVFEDLDSAKLYLGIKETYE